MDISILIFPFSLSSIAIKLASVVLQEAVLPLCHPLFPSFSFKLFANSPVEVSHFKQLFRYENIYFLDPIDYGRSGKASKQTKLKTLNNSILQWFESFSAFPEMIGKPEEKASTSVIGGMVSVLERKYAVKITVSYPSESVTLRL